MKFARLLKRLAGEFRKTETVLADAVMVGRIENERDGVSQLFEIKEAHTQVRDMMKQLEGKHAD